MAPRIRTHTKNHYTYSGSHQSPLFGCPLTHGLTFLLPRLLANRSPLSQLTHLLKSPSLKCSISGAQHQDSISLQQLLTAPEDPVCGAHWSWHGQWDGARLSECKITRRTDVAPADKRPTQYKNIVIKRWGLRRRARRKPSGIKDNVYHILHAHWTRCTKAYADEKQRLYIAAGILLSFISSGRLVSLFDTRIKTGDEKAGDRLSKGVLHTVSKGSKRKTNHRHHHP
ncbi:hypothetical protein RJ035_004475 [Blastomyces gilchristii]